MLSFILEDLFYSIVIKYFVHLVLVLYCIFTNVTSSS